MKRPRNARWNLGFTAAAGSRLGLVAAYAVLALAGVTWVEARDTRPPREPGAPAVAPPHPDSPPAPQPAQHAPATATARLQVEATYGVAVWRISVAGHELAPDRADAHHWEGPLPAGANSATELLVEGIAADNADGAPHALRVRLPAEYGGGERVEWSSGDVVSIVPLAPLGSR